jgi:hypothetical protein
MKGRQGTLPFFGEIDVTFPGRSHNLHVMTVKRAIGNGLISRGATFLQSGSRKK